MIEKNKQKWNEILKFAVTVLTALLGVGVRGAVDFRVMPMRDIDMIVAVLQR